MLEFKYEEKKKIIQKRILLELAEFYKQHRSGLPMKILSSRYAKSSQNIGGLTELLNEMREEGKIRIEYSESGARTIWLGDGKAVVTTQTEKVWF